MCRYSIFFQGNPWKIFKESVKSLIFVGVSPEGKIHEYKITLNEVQNKRADAYFLSFLKTPPSLFLPPPVYIFHIWISLGHPQFIKFKIYFDPFRPVYLSAGKTKTSPFILDLKALLLFIKYYLYQVSKIPLNVS